MTERRKLPIFRRMLLRALTLSLGLVLWASTPGAFAQGERRTYAHGTFGYGSMEDDQGSLGRGLALGVSLGRVIVDEVEVELSVTRYHHQRSLATAWDGDITSYVGRVLYRTGGSGSTARFVAGVGAGYYSYAGTISETIFPSVSSTPVVDRFDYSFSGVVYETGVGLEIVAGRNAFARPELWATIPRGQRNSGGRTPEPPFLITRGAVVVGIRF